MARGDNAQLEGGRELNYVTQRDNYSGSLFCSYYRSGEHACEERWGCCCGKSVAPS